MNYGALFRSALVALLRNKMRSILTVLGITIGIAAVICVVAIGRAGQARVQQQLNNLGDNFVWMRRGSAIWSLRVLFGWTDSRLANRDVH